ncbi:hypothetical protein HELRODRAFT_159097 [Helobdella robusta]|uniref:DNA-dependent protein kinase catalytic subunit CC3 domain-containing protein n=1 Tax=Helobdella robusta TaxID=6412 RepID=T1ENL0_HELRO|nr:hypothetical protein HELRODRAFT_159097 [Helobdella robusta]ESO12540.1 hypothetical protein HELRODRAFT_159097 [Helobdella robusta]
MKKEIMEKLDGMYKNEEQYKTQHRKSIFYKIFYPTLESATEEALLEDYFIAHVLDIMSTLNKKIPYHLDVKLDSHFLNKICCLDLITLFYSRLSKDSLHSLTSKVNSEYCKHFCVTDIKGKELTTSIIRTAKDFKSDDYHSKINSHKTTPSSPLDDFEMQRLLNCSSFNTLSHVLMRTQTDVKFYTAFLFTENLAKGEIIWENLIDTKRLYKFSIEITDAEARKMKYKTLRKQIRIHTQGKPGVDAEDEEEDNDNVQYLSTLDSSVSADLTQLIPKSNHFSVNKSVPHQSTPTLDFDEMNCHESMQTLMTIIHHINENIAPFQSSPTSAAAPTWLSCIIEKISSPSTRWNVVIFLVKVIVNCQQILKYFASFLIGPLLKVAQDCRLYEHGSNTISNDVVVMLLLWSDAAKPMERDRDMLSRLLEALVRNSDDSNRSVMRNNVEIIKVFLESWKDIVDVPTKILLEKISERNISGKQNIYGLQMVGAVLAKQILPYEISCDLETKHKFFKSLSDCMLCESKSVYCVAAEVLGMGLNLLSLKDADVLKDAMVLVSKSMSNFKDDKFITCLHKMQLNYPAICERYKSKVLFMIPNVYGIYQIYCLEILKHYCDRSLFVDLKLASLKFVHALLTHLTVDDLTLLIPHLFSVGNHTSVECRVALNEIFMWIYDQYYDKKLEDKFALEIDNVKKSLIGSLQDEDDVVRTLAYNYWRRESHLPKSADVRLKRIISHMYQSTSEASFLTYACDFLMELTSWSSEFNKELFDMPLSECIFQFLNGRDNTILLTMQDVQIHSDWRERHSMMTPLFVETQMSISTPSLSSSSSSLPVGQVRITQAPSAFDSIQSQSNNPTFDWLTQESIDVSALTATARSSSSLLFSRTSHQVRLQSSAEPDREVFDDVKKLRRRFQKYSDQEENLYFIKKATKMGKQKEDENLIRKQSRENDVRMVRNYRMGELPDIQIKHRHLIAPLQALAQRDGQTSRLLFTSLFKGIVTEQMMKCRDDDDLMMIHDDQVDKEDQDMTAWFTTFNESFNKCLQESACLDPQFISTALELCFEYVDHISIAPQLITKVALSANVQPLGILLLEKIIVTLRRNLKSDQVPTCPPRKIRKKMEATGEISLIDECWIELAKLYKSISDYNHVRCIFAYHLTLPCKPATSAASSNVLKSSDVTKLATEAEMSRDYVTAFTYYNQGVNIYNDEDISIVGGNAGAVLSFVMNYWDDCRLQCIERLGQWKNVEQICHNKVRIETISDDNHHRLDDFWKDDTFFYLSYLMKSETKLLLASGGGDPQLQHFLSFIDRNLKIRERKHILENTFYTELALLSLWEDDHFKARHYVELARNAFCREWSHTSRAQQKNKLSRLQKLHVVKELQGVIEATSSSGR